MKKFLVLLLIFMLLATSSSFASVVIPTLIPTPIVVEPIFDLPIMPTFNNTKALYTEPLYRLYSDEFEVHTYTSSENDRADLIADGWTDDGVIAYVSPVKLKNTEMLYKFNFIGKLSRLSTDYSLVDLGWTVTGVIGYVPTDGALGYAKVHESLRELEEGDWFWDTDYYYGSNYATFGPYITVPSVPEGYNWAGGTITDMWESNTQLQALQIDDVPSNLTGSESYEINWETLKAEGYVKLLYSTDNGDTWTTIVENLEQTGTTGSYDWTLPNITNSEMKLRALWSPYTVSGSFVWDTSNTFSVTSSGGIIFIPILPPVEIITLSPTAPSSLTASTTLSEQQISLYWTDNTETETGYVIERKIEGGLYTQIGTAGINATGFVDTTVSAGVPYTYRVKATGVLADSAYSNEVTKTYFFVFEPVFPEGFIIPEVPEPPTDALAEFTDGSETEALITWEEPSEEVSGYKIERNTGMAWATIGTTTEDDLDYVDTDLDGLTGEISYRVRSYKDAYLSSPSNVTSVTLTEENPSGLVLDGSQSGWAESELHNAYANGLTYSGVMNNFGQNITREEFCTIAVKLYEKLSGMPATSGADPFDDTDNPNILKAYNLGIVYGISANEFAPTNNITRQEMCVMIYRALDAAGFNTDVDPAASFGFGDKSSIASWAMDQVKFCHQNGIMSGTSTSTIAPLLNTPREQAIALINRAHNTFNP